MDWFKKHVDTVIVLGGLFSVMVWFDGKFEKIDQRFAKIDERFAKIDDRLSHLEQDMAVMKAVLVMQKIMPSELVANTQESNRK